MSMQAPGRQEPRRSRRLEAGRQAARPAAAKAAAPERLNLVEPAFAALATVLAIVPFREFYGTLGWAPAMAGAVLLGALLGVLARRWPGWLVVLTGAAAMAAYTLYVCYPTETFYGLPSLDALRSLGTGLSSGWAKMLTVALPADVVGDLLATPVALAFLAGLAAALLAVRTRLVTVLVLPPLLLLVAGLLFTASRPGSWLLAIAVFLPGALILLLLRGNRTETADRTMVAADDPGADGLDKAARRWHSTFGRIAFGLPVVAVVGALGVAGANYLPIADGSNRADPRDLRQQEFRLAATLTPLVLVKPQLVGTKSELFTVKVTQRGGSVAIDRVRTATLDSYDGALWTQSRDFLITGSTLPEGPKFGAPPVTVDLDVHVGRLGQPFLPVFGRPVKVSGADLAFDPANGTLVSTRPTVSDYDYRVEGEVRSQGGIAQAAAPTDMPQYTQLVPPPPEWLTRLADEITKDYTTPWTQLNAIEKYLQKQGYLLDGKPGHSYGALLRALQGPRDEQVGYAEQYAAAFAVLARAKGYAARVAVGYRLQKANQTGDTFKVYTSDAHAWGEVFLTGYGWVQFEPTNTGNPSTSKPPRDADAPVLPTNPKNNKEKPAQPKFDPAAPAGTETGAGGFVSSRMAYLVGGLALGVPLLLLGLIVLLKANRRRSRRHRGGPADQVVAAWLEVLDRLRERGQSIPDSTTPIEVAMDARNGPAAEALQAMWELASTATAAVCAPVPPMPDAADRAWELEAELRRSISAATPLAVRVRALIDPRPLLPSWLRRNKARPAAPTDVADAPAELVPQDATDRVLTTTGS